MLNERDEFLNMVASGLYASLLADLVAETDKDKRRLLIDQRCYTGKLWSDSYDTLGYIPASESIMRCWNFIDEEYYNPRFLDAAVPFVVDPGISGGDTLTANANQPEIPGSDPVAQYTVFVWRWDYVAFELVGTLADNNQPGAGNYVLALATVDESAPDVPTLTGLPSSPFLELTS